MVDDYTRDNIRAKYKLDTGDDIVYFYIPILENGRKIGLEKGVKCEIVYTKRTEMLIDFKKIE